MGTIYLAGLAALYTSIAISWAHPQRRNQLLLGALLFLACIAIFRGDVGTDTFNYERISGLARRRGIGGDYEPGFVGLVTFLTNITTSDVLAARLLSAIYVGLLLLYIYKADEDELFVLFLYIIPAFFYNHSMNGLRIGIASAILLIATQNFRRGNQIRGTLLNLSASLIQYTSAISIVFIWLMSRPLNLSRSMLYSAALLIFTLSAMVISHHDYIINKIIVFANQPPPSALSGTTKILTILILLVGVAASGLPKTEKIKLLSVCGSSLLALIVLAQLSTAGIRMLDLVSILVPMAVLVSFARHGLHLDAKMKSALVAAGLVSAMAIYRNFLSLAGTGRTPFIPYETLF